VIDSYTGDNLLEDILQESGEPNFTERLSPEITTSKINGLGRFLPIISFDLIALSIVLLATYEWVNSKLWNGWVATAYFLGENIDRVVFYGGLVLLAIMIFKWNNLYEHQVIQTRVEQFFCIVRSFLLTDVTVIVISFIFF
jgi:hypothetical protein